MDFSQAFPTIMKTGGFDAIVGNPPYIRIQVMKEWAPLEVELYKQKYITATKGNYDIYVAFVERSLSLLSKIGRLGFILPNKFLNAQYGQPLRRLIAAGQFLEELVHFGSNQVFAGATTYTCLLFLDKAGSKTFRFTKVDDLIQWRTSGLALSGDINTSTLDEGEWNFVVGEGSKLFEQLRAGFKTLNDVADIFVGLQTSADEVFILDVLEETPRTLKLFSKSLRREYVLEKELLHVLVSGTDVNRYAPLPTRQYILFPYQMNDGKMELIPFLEIEKLCPRTAEYLLENKKQLQERERGKGKGPEWYGYIYRKNMALQSMPKLCVPRLVESLYSAFDDKGVHFLDNVDVCGIKWIGPYESYPLEFLLGLLNSRLLKWYFPHVSAPFRGGYLSANRQFLGQVPIALPAAQDKEAQTSFATLTKLVARRLLAQSEYSDSRTDRDKDLYLRKCNTLDGEIDRVVYDLYGLDQSEIELIERTIQ